MQVLGVRYRRMMINGAPVMAAPAEMDITIVADKTGTESCGTSGPHALIRIHKALRA